LKFLQCTAAAYCMFMKDFSQWQSPSGKGPLSNSLNTWRRSVVLGSVCCLGLMMAIALQPFFSVGDFTRDPATIALHPPYFGAVSNIGILLWSASAAVCFLSGILLKIMQPERPDLHSFFSIFAVLNMVLCLDDTFLLHEAILPNRLPLVSIPEPAIVTAYGLGLLGAIVSFRKLLLKNQPLLFGLTLLLFSVSVGFDQLLPDQLLSEDTVFLIEDGSKLLAVFLWLAYFIRASIYFVTQPRIELANTPAARTVASPVSSLASASTSAPTSGSTEEVRH